MAELELAVRAVTRGETHLSSRISKHVIGSYLERMREGPLREELTPRQREIVQLIAEGKSTKEIAFLLKISVKTVEAHRAVDGACRHSRPGRLGALCNADARAWCLPEQQPLS